MAVSLKDISKATGINTCSVSQVLNNHSKAMSLRPETREKNPCRRKRTWLLQK